MKAEKTAILLMNVGSPDRPAIWPVWKYLTQFLNDKCVIDLPLIPRMLLVNLIIIPFRVRHSTNLYKQLWRGRGSPLIYHSLDLQKKLQLNLGDNYKVFLGMRYGNPGYKKAIDKIINERYKRLLVLPLFPQYAMSTSETAIAAINREVKKSKADLQIIFKKQFYDYPEFIEALAEQANKYDYTHYDHIIFSYHGLPDRQLEKCHPGIKVADCQCQDYIPKWGKYCYRATCFATTRSIVNRLNLKPGKYSVSFQSRLSKNWMEPFTDEVILKKLSEGKKRILIMAPSFVTDCLETKIEIGKEYYKMFLEKGGEELQLVPSLNSEPVWIEALSAIILNA
ncbi:MAG: ferrochelatase [Prolixibacteraceae bacterium]|nr:ferrochelatase [Prolixibacteraceae bacterium]